MYHLLTFQLASQRLLQVFNRAKLLKISQKTEQKEKPREQKKF